MSHGFIFLAFHDGEPASIPYKDLNGILQEHDFSVQELIDGANEIQTPESSDGSKTIGDHLFVNVADSRVTEIEIRRPIYDESFRRLAYSFITELRLTMISSGGEVLRTSLAASAHLPNDFVAQFSDVDTNVASLEQLP